MKLKLLFCFCLIALTSWPALAQASEIHNPNTLQLRQDLNQILTDQRFSYPDYFSGIKRMILALDKALQSLNLPHYQIKAPRVDRTLNQLGLGLAMLLPLGLMVFSRKFITREKKVKASSATIFTCTLNASESFLQAQTLASQGEYRLAVRLLYLAALSVLRGMGSLPEGTGFSDKANLRTLRRKFGAESCEYQSFEQLVNLFQEKWYGLKNCTSNDYQNATRFYETLASCSALRK